MGFLCACPCSCCSLAEKALARDWGMHACTVPSQGQRGPWPGVGGAARSHGGGMRLLPDAGGARDIPPRPHPSSLSLASWGPVCPPSSKLPTLSLQLGPLHPASARYDGSTPGRETGHPGGLHAVETLPCPLLQQLLSKHQAPGRLLT